MWVDNVATLFGGLDVCALEVLVGKDGKEWIIEVNDSALSLMVGFLLIFLIEKYF